MRKLIFLLILFASSTFAQRLFIKPPTPTIEPLEVATATYTLGTTHLDSIKIKAIKGTIVLDSLTGTSNITFPSDTQLLANSNRFFTNSNGWILNGDWDTTISPSDSSMVIYDSAGATFELAVPTTLNQGHVFSFTVSEGETQLLSNYAFEDDEANWTFGAAIATHSVTEGVLEFTGGGSPAGLSTRWVYNSVTLDTSKTYIYKIRAKTTSISANLELSNGYFEILSDQPLTNNYQTFEVISCFETAYSGVSAAILSNGNKICLGGTLDSAILIDYIKVYEVDESQSVESSTGYWTYGDQVLGTTDTITSTETTYTFPFISNGSDTLKLVLSDTAKVKLSDVSFTRDYDYDRINYGDSLYKWYYADISVIGDYTEKIYVNSNKQDSVDINYSVIPSSNVLTAPYALTATANTSGILVAVRDSNVADTVITTFYDFDDDDYSGLTESVAGCLSIPSENLRITDNDYASSWLSAYKTYAVTSDTYYRVTVTGMIGTANSWWLVITDDATAWTYYANKSFTADSTVVFGFTPSHDGNITVYLQAQTDNGEYAEFDDYKFENTEPSYDALIIESQPFLAGLPNGEFSELTTITNGDTSYQHTGLNDGDEYNYRARFIDGTTYSSYSNEDSDTFIVATQDYTPTYYVSSSSGDDGNDGSQSAPFETITKVNSLSLTSGQVVAFKRGDVFSDTYLDIQEGGAYGDSIIFTSYGTGNKPTIGAFGSTLAQTVYIDTQYIILDNLKIIVGNNVNGITYTEGNISIQNCEVVGDSTSHRSSTRGIYGTSNGVTDSVRIYNNTIHEMAKGIYVNQPYNVLITYNQIYDMYYWDGQANVGGIGITFSTNGEADAFDCNYTTNINHNEIYNFEHSAMWIGAVSKVIVEYNYIHDNLDERIYIGGSKHGTVGKFFDNTGETLGSVGNIFRYNYVYNLERRGEPYYRYKYVSRDSMNAGLYYVSSTSTGSALTTYEGVYGLVFNGQPDALLSGLGYGNHWIHNNVFYKTTQQITSRGYTKYLAGVGDASGSAGSFRDDLPSFFVNNTMLNVGTKAEVTGYFGVVQIDNIAQSPTVIQNNIFDMDNADGEAAVYCWEDSLNVTFNIFINRADTTYTQPTIGSDKAIWLRNDNIDSADIGNQYKVTPNWNDSTSTFFAENIGVSGVYLPDLRILSGGNSHNTGVPVNTSPANQDGSGRSLLYDILDTLRTTTDIGAVGIFEE